MDGDLNNATAKENVATLLPQVTPNGPILSKGLDDDFDDTLNNEISNASSEIKNNDEKIIDQKEKDLKSMMQNTIYESVEDEVINAETSSDVSRDTRKLIAKVYNLQIDIAKAEVNNDDKNDKKVIDLKREYIHQKTALANIKKNASGALKKAINEVEKVAKEASTKYIEEIKKENDEKERVQEGVAISDINGYFITEMNHAKGILSDAVMGTELKTVGQIKDTVVDKNEVIKAYPDAIKKATEYGNQIKAVRKIADQVFARYKNIKLNNTISFDNAVEKLTGDNIEPNFHKFGNKYVYMVAEALYSFDCPYGTKSDKLTIFTMALHYMRKMVQDIQKLNKNPMVIVKCETYDYKKDKIKGVVITATIRASLGKAETTDKNKVVKESTDEPVKEVSPELKRLDEKRGKLAELNADLKEAKEKLIKTGDHIYENKIKGLTAKIEKLDSELKKDEEKLKKEEKKIKEVKESVGILTMESKDMEESIRPIVEKLNAKGYKVKYASPGHNNLRKKEDHEPDGVYYGKLYSDARIMFADKYDFPDAPKYWHWRDVDGCSYLDITPEKYDDKSGDTPNDAFTKWKDNYMNSLKSFVDSLPDNKGNKENEDDEVKESVNEFADNVIDSIYERMGLLDDMEDEISNYTESMTLNSDNTLLKELDNLLS